MSRLPPIDGRDMVRFLERRGFEVVRIRGSHHILQSGELRTSVPVHSGRSLKIGTLRGILRDVEMNPADFTRLLRE